ncbi:hypothetical protein [Brachybacterium sacelli]|uniref:Uncharacterized protein n=1 Tax=Brachybacterium sacelli TaxID=173364 RepID=A0ABS4X7I9_9MICO|nr:hypothetical protein [Brachybacterium sacelli]MBP2384422.1 hypothetical protein [Brachybacterium sacelli]
MPTRRRHQVDDLFDTAEAVPDLSARARGMRRYRAARRAVFASVILAPLNVLGLILMFSIVLNGVETTGPGTAQVEATQTGRTQAERSLEQWLAADESVFAGAEITSWDGTSHVEAVEATAQDIGYQLMTHDFTLRTADGVYYRAAVRTAYSPSKGVKVLSTPTVTPLPPSAVADWEPTEPTEGWETTGDSASTTDAITSWAQALATSPNELKLATRDEDPAHVYSTLTGVDVTSVSIIQAVSPVSDDGEMDSSTVVATVSVELTDADAEESTGEASTTVQYDVLVRGADTAAPYVTAWGATGSGTGLSDYENAASLDGDVDDPTTDTSAASDGGGETAEPAPTTEGQE